MNYEITGKLVEKFETQQVTDRFRKREFVLEIRETYNTFERINHIKFQASQERCSLLDFVDLNEDIKVTFNVQGRRWEKGDQVYYINTLEARLIEKASAGQPQPDVRQSAPVPQSSPGISPANLNGMPPADNIFVSEEPDDLPF